MRLRIVSGNRGTLSFLILLTGLCSGCNKNNPKGMDYKTSTISYILSSGTNTSLFETAVRQAGLDSIFNGTGPFTVFVPTNDAFNGAGISPSAVSAYSEKAAKDLVLYHTVAGSALMSSSFIGARELKVIVANGDSIFISGDSNRIFINGIQVTAADVQAANGVMYALQGVLAPPQHNLTELVNADTSLSFLSHALTLATAVPDSLPGRLASGGPFSFFAPDNDAFRKLGYQAPQDLDPVNRDSLRSMILSHLVPQRLFSYDIPDSSAFQTVNDSTLYFSLSGITLRTGGPDTPATVVSANEMATNGVLFKIDAAPLH